jgi:hypothetical protein
MRATTVKRGFGIGFLKISGEKLSSQPELVEPFKLELKNKIQELDLTLDQLYNADETGLYWKLLPDRTFVSLTEKTGMGRFAAAVSPRPIRRHLNLITAVMIDSIFTEYATHISRNLNFILDH